MAFLSCVDAIKSCSRTPSRRVREDIEEIAALEGPSCRRQQSSRSSLFPIEVIDEDVAQHQVKIHYNGFSDKHDEWIRKSQIHYIPVLVSPSSSEDLQSHNFATLACCIKQKLYPSKIEDPKV